MFVWSVIFGLAALSGAFGFPAIPEPAPYSPPASPGVDASKTVDVTGIKTRIRVILEQTLDIGDKEAISNSTTLHVRVDKRDAKSQCGSCSSGQCDCSKGQCSCSDGQCGCPTGCQDQKPDTNDTKPESLPLVKREREADEKLVASTTDDPVGTKESTKAPMDEDDEDEDQPKNKTNSQESGSDISGGYEAMLNSERREVTKEEPEIAATVEVAGVSATLQGNAAQRTEEAPTLRLTIPAKDSAERYTKSKDVVKRDTIEADIQALIHGAMASLEEVKPAYKDWDYLYPKMNQVRLSREAAKIEIPNDSSVKNDSSPGSLNTSKHGSPQSKRAATELKSKDVASNANLKGDLLSGKNESADQVTERPSVSGSVAFSVKRDSETATTGKEAEGKPGISATQKATTEVPATVQDGSEIQTENAVHSARVKRDGEKASTGSEAKGKPETSATGKVAEVPTQDGSETQRKSKTDLGSARVKRGSEQASAVKEADLSATAGEPEIPATEKVVAPTVQDRSTTQTKEAEDFGSANVKRDSEKASSGKEAGGKPGIPATENIADISETAEDGSKTEMNSTSADLGSARVKQDTGKASTGKEAEDKPRISATAEVAEVSAAVQDVSKNQTKNAADLGSARVKRDSEQASTVVEAEVSAATEGEHGNSATEKLAKVSATVHDDSTTQTKRKTDRGSARVNRDSEQASTGKEDVSATKKEHEAGVTENVAVSATVKDATDNTDDDASSVGAHEHASSTEKAVNVDIKKREDEPAEVAEQVRQLPSGGEPTNPEAATPKEVSDASTKDLSNEKQPEKEEYEPAKVAKQVRQLPSGEDSTMSNSPKEATPEEVSNAPVDLSEGKLADKKDYEPAKVAKQVRELSSIEESTKTNNPEEATPEEEVSNAPVKDLPNEKRPLDEETQKKESDLQASNEDERKNAPTVAEPKDVEAKKRLQSGLESSWGDDTHDSDSWQQERRLSDDSKPPGDPRNSLDLNNLDIRHLGGNDLPIPPVDITNFHPQDVAGEPSSMASPVPAKSVQLDLSQARSASNQNVAPAIFMTSLALVTILKV